MRRKAFKLRSVVDLNDLKEGDFISESDLALQHQSKMWQFKYITKNKKHKTAIKPGIWQLGNSSAGTKLSKIDLVDKRILPDLVNTAAIIAEAKSFFSKLDVYKELEIKPKRGVLLYSAPGYGKSATITMFCRQAIEEDKGTVVIIWPTSKVSADDVQDFLTAESAYSKLCTRLIFVLEDIGGGNSDSEGARAVDSGLLNLLDGIGDAFKLPTFIVATTNTPERLLASLSDRPGRFDMFIELKPPSAADRLKLFEFIAKRSATHEEATAICSPKSDGLSAAHIVEVVVRHRLNDIAIVDVIEILLKHSAKVRTNFTTQTKMGLGIDGDDF